MNSGKKKQKRILYLDLLRIIATIAVIIIHVSAQNWYSTNISSFAWNIFNIFDSAVRWAVPIFVMISGALFLDNDIDMDIKKLYKKNILRLITSYIFWSSIYSIDKALHGANSNAIIISFIEGHFHMWFLHMIIGLYILIPILRKITFNKKYTEYFLIIGIILIFIIPRLLNLLECTELLKSSEVSLFLKYILNLKIGYVVYFVLGFYLSKYNIKPIFNRAGYILGIIAFIVTTLLTIWHSNKQGIASTVFYDNFSINVMLMSISLFIFAKHILSKIKWSKKSLNFISKFSKYSFGIYLVHVLVMDKLAEYFNLNTLTFNPLLSIIIIIILVTSISYIISSIINHIPILKKYIV